MKPHLHFMGIGGVSMRGLARWCLADGHEVTGCDAADSPTLERLRAEGVRVHVGHGPHHLDGVDTLVTTMAVDPNEPEVRAARERGVRTIRRIDLLGELFGARDALAVTGTHGKSTTTGMLATVLLELGDDPSIQLGATLSALGGNARYGRGRLLVAEVDESDPGFAALRAEVAVVTNLEDDHIAGDFKERRNYHASLADLEVATRRFAAQAGRVVFCSDWASLETLLGDLPQAVRYGAGAGADYRIDELRLEPAGSRFALWTPAGARHEVVLNVPGRYNVQNATAALAAVELAGLPIERALEPLAGFAGVGRRWQRWGEVEGAMLIDDYAHHPTEVAATLEAARNTGRRVRAVLQPHRWVRTARHWRALADAAALADEVLVLDVYAAGEEPIAGVGAEPIVERLRGAGVRSAHYSASAAIEHLAATLEPEDLIITLGAGDVWKVAAALSERAEPTAEGALATPQETSDAC